MSIFLWEIRAEFKHMWVRTGGPRDDKDPVRSIKFKIKRHDTVPADPGVTWHLNQPPASVQCGGASNKERLSWRAKWAGVYPPLPPDCDQNERPHEYCTVVPSAPYHTNPTAAESEQLFAGAASPAALDHINFALTAMPPTQPPLTTELRSHRNTADATALDHIIRSHRYAADVTALDHNFALTAMPPT